MVRIQLTSFCFLLSDVYLSFSSFHCANTSLLICLLDSSLVSKENVEGSWKSDLESQHVSGLNFFEIQTLQTATNNFSASNKLGQGGFGTVYKVRDTVPSI